MQIFDRYLLWLFAKVFLACFVSLVGLYIVIDAFSNLDEFLGYGRQQGVLPVLVDYYSARLPWFFDRASGLLALIAAMSTITLLQRTNEMTALMAAGIANQRILRPLIAAAVGVSLLAVANRELLIPRVRSRLVRNAQDWLGEAARHVTPVTDNRTGILIGGRTSFANAQRIEDATFTLHRQLGGFGRKLIADDAYYQPPQGDRPGGYLLDGVTEPAHHALIPSVIIDGAPVILSPADTSWLQPHQCFVASAVSFPHLAEGTQWREFASTGELVAGLRNPSLDFGLRTRVIMHARFVQPLLDMTLLLLGLPLVLTRRNRNVFVALGLCAVVVVGYYGVLFICQGMGSSGFLLTPAQAAWCPLIVLAPLAAGVSQALWE